MPRGPQQEFIGRRALNYCAVRVNPPPRFGPAFPRSAIEPDPRERIGGDCAPQRYFQIDGQLHARQCLLAVATDNGDAPLDWAGASRSSPDAVALRADVAFKRARAVMALSIAAHLVRIIDNKEARG
jgi:hypothetical protein